MKRIPLTLGLWALVDDIDYEALSRHKWCASKNKDANTYYALRATPRPNKSTVQMHREILKPPPNIKVDHRNRNGLDNRRSNIRLATSSQNCCNSIKPCTNTSGYKGVSWDKSRKKWRAYIKINGRYITVGRFANKMSAVQARREASKTHHGEFAR